MVKDFRLKSHDVSLGYKTRTLTGMSRSEIEVEALVTRQLDRQVFQSGLTRLQFPAALY